MNVNNENNFNLYLFAKSQREKQIRAVSHAISVLLYTEKDVSPPMGINEARWRAMINTIFINGELK